MILASLTFAFLVGGLAGLLAAIGLDAALGRTSQQMYDTGYDDAQRGLGRRNTGAWM